MSRTGAAVVVVIGCAFALAARAGPAAPPAAAPATAPAADPWAGEYTQFGGFRPAGADKDGPRRVSLARVGDHYRLRGAQYDDYEFVEDSPGVLWDRKHILGTISRGTLTFAPGRLGARPP